MIKECVVCGGEFEARNSRHKTCGAVCSHKNFLARKRDRNRLPTQTRCCVACGKEFMAAGEKRKKTCSPECSDFHRKARQSRQKREAYVPSGTVKQCIVCGADFKFHRNKMTCSRACNRERNRALNKVRASAMTPEQRRNYERQYRAKRSAALKLIREIETKGLREALR